MSAWEKRLSVISLCIAGLAMLGLSGCGGFGADPVPVSGAVTLNDLPLPFALVVYHPEEIGGTTVAAVTDIRGRYFLREGEMLGVPPGAYRVTVRYFTGPGGLTERPRAVSNFSGEALEQLMPPKYSRKDQTELNVVVLPVEADEPNSFIHALTGDDVPLPPGAQQRPGVIDEAPEKKEGPTEPVAPTGRSRFMTGNILVYGGGLLLFLLAAGGVFFFVSRRRGLSAETADFAYLYDGEVGGASAEPGKAVPRRKKKRKKKKVRKKSAGQQNEPAAPIPEGESEPSGQPDAGTEGSPFPVLDEGMDDDDIAAAFLAGDEASFNQPKPAGGDAALARWMLEAGGFVKVQSDDSEALNVKKMDDLPEGKFHVQGVFFEGVEDFGDEQLAKIKDLPHLDTLDLASTDITDTGLKALELLPSIKTLALSRTAVSDAGLEHLTALPNLRVLLLYRTKVTDDGIEQLKKLTKLKTVELKRTKISKDAAKELQEALPKCKVIL